MPKQILSETINIAPEDILKKVVDQKNEGARLVQICCTKTSVYEMIYSFDLDYKFINLKCTFENPVELVSITGIYPGAFLYENEIHDLFGLVIKGINVDYHGTLYKTAVKFPFVSGNSKTSDSK